MKGQIAERKNRVKKKEGQKCQNDKTERRIKIRLERKPFHLSLFYFPYLPHELMALSLSLPFLSLPPLFLLFFSSLH